MSGLDEQAVRDALKVVKDPEIGISIIDLGLVYDVEIDAGKVDVKMTLTSPGCPVGPQIMQEVDETVRGLIIAHAIDEKLRYAAKAVPNVDLHLYEVQFHLHPVAQPARE